jgi:hypothetical protein
MDQLDSIGLDGKLKAQGSNDQEREVEPSSDDKVVVHQLQVEDILVDDNVTIISEDTGGQVKSL